MINECQFCKHENSLAQARDEVIVVVCGHTDVSSGWFFDPTVLEVTESYLPFMTEDLFASVLTTCVYDNANWNEALRLVDESTASGLTGAVFAQDAGAVATADDALPYAADNFHVNDRPTGTVVEEQPFGGALASGTSDKAGTVWNLIRFASPRTTKRNHLPATDYRYPHHQL